MQKSCSQTGGGVGEPPLQVINPDDLTEVQAANLLTGRLLYRPIPPAFNVSTTKKVRTVGSFPFYYVYIILLQVFKPRKRNIIIRWAPDIHPTTWMIVTKTSCFRWMDVWKE